MMAEQVTDNKKFIGIRLPTSIKPFHYALSLEPEIDKSIFNGTVEIDYEANESVQQITLNSVDLEITEGYLLSGVSGTEVIPLTTVTYSLDSETVTLEFGGETIPKFGTLKLTFNGHLNDKNKGFYRVSFKLNEQAVCAASTQFAPVDTRRSFPCWDEPAYKATFIVELIHERTLEFIDYNSIHCIYNIVALSNMPPQHIIKLPNGKVKTIFKKTPIMSTYLLAYIVGPFEMVEGSNGKCPVRVYTTAGKTEQGRFALDVACKSLAFYEEYFGIPYPLPKMDFIAIPECTFGGMENWGLITYRETCLLVDGKNTATSIKQSIVLIIAHELAHQWFGNLVTMDWWTDLWLNEGFATFMQYLCTDSIYPEYNIWSQFVSDTYALALDLDSLHNSHPIEVPVKHPSEINQIFDFISYKKGASVIRMLYNYVGSDSFREGMKLYLTKFSYANASTKDLWVSLREASGKPIHDIMSNWTSEMGYPWINVELSYEEKSIKLELKQEKFTADGKLSKNDENICWLVPIDALIGPSGIKHISLNLLEEKTGVFFIEGTPANWVKLNSGSITLYRCAYPESMLEKLSLAISDQTLPPMDRLGIQDDYFALCQAGKVKTIQLLKLLEAFKGESHFSVWRSIDSNLDKLNLLLSFTDYQSKFHAFGRQLYSDIFKRLTWQSPLNEKDADVMTRSLVINRLVTFCDSNIIEESKRRFKAHLEGSEFIPADLRSAIYRAVSVHGDEEAFEGLFSLYDKAERQEEQQRIANALAATKGTDRIERVIDFLLSSKVRKTDKVYNIIKPMSMTSPLATWKLFKDKKDFFIEMVSTGVLLTKLVKFTTENLASEELAQEICSFFKENKIAGTERALSQSLETIRLRASWLSRELESIKSFLTQFNE